MPEGIEQELEAVCRVWDEPEDWLCFSHGDPAPTNNHIRGGTVRLVDFEYGAYRHALYDLTAWNVLCPLPEERVAEMCALFRRLIARAITAAGDDEAFDFHWSALCVYRALAMVGWFPVKLLENDLPWVGEWSMRMAMLSSCKRLSGVRSPGFRAMSDLAAGMSRVLLERWPEAGDGSIPWSAFTGKRA